MKIEYHPLAEVDIEGVLEHYRVILPSLANEFLSEFDQTVLNIAKNPYRYRVFKNEIRVGKLGRFPYAIFFRLEGETLWILVVRHHRQHPSYGLDRI